MLLYFIIDFPVMFIVDDGRVSSDALFLKNHNKFNLDFR